MFLVFSYKSTGFMGFTRLLCGFIHGLTWFQWFHTPAVAKHHASQSHTIVLSHLPIIYNVISRVTISC